MCIRDRHDIQRGTIGQEGHILLGQHAGNDALVAVTAGHLVAHLDLSLIHISLGGIEDRGTGGQRAGVDTEEAQAAHIGVGHDLERQG